MRHSRVLFLLSALAGGPLAGCYAEAHTAPVDETV